MFSFYGKILSFLLFRNLYFLRGSQQIKNCMWNWRSVTAHRFLFLTGETFAVLSAFLLAFGSIQIFDNSQFSEELLSKVIFFLSLQTLAQNFWWDVTTFPFCVFSPPECFSGTLKIYWYTWNHRNLKCNFKS